jgi:REP element-mobilizing transposase RayT
MTRRLPIIAYHIVFGAYGFWLPNDPRGSWSRYVWAPRLQRFGQPEPISASHDATPLEEGLREQMKRELAYPPVRFTGLQARAIGGGFADIVRKLGLVIYSAAIMPDHVHLVAARQEMYAETIAGFLKRAASRALRNEDLHPMIGGTDHKGRLPSPWEEHGWKVFLHTQDEIQLANEYVNNNPIEAGLRRQHWSWIKPFDA